MEALYIYFIYFVTLIAYSGVGIYIYSKERLKQQVNMKEVWKLFWIIVVLRVFDVLSTIYFTTKLGTEYEGNLIARAFMDYFGIHGGIALIFLLSIPFMFFWFIMINYIFKNKTGWRIFKVLMITISIIVPLINLSA